MTAKIIFVVSDGRTGSTLLCQLLDQYQQITNMNEALLHVSDDLLIRNKEFGYHLRKKFNNITLGNKEFQNELLKNPPVVISEISSYFTDTVILKLHLTEFKYLEEENLNWVLSQPNHEFILLERPNYLDVYISLEIAKQTNLWHNDNTSNIKVNINPTEFILELGRYNMRYNNIKKELKNHNIDYLRLDYDKDLKNYTIDKFTDLITPWFINHGIDLQLDPLKEKVKVRRQNTNEDIFDNISNREEILDMIKTKNLNINLVDNV